MIYILLVAVILCIFIAIFFVALINSKRINEKGYTYILDYFEKIGNPDYYNNFDQWITSKYKSSYELIKASRDHWYIKLIGKKTIEQFICFYELAEKLTLSISTYLDADHYFTASELFENKEQIRKIDSIWNDLKESGILSTSIKLYGKEKGQVLLGRNASIEIGNLRSRHNQSFVEKELMVNKEFFDTVIENPLDPQQRESIVKLEDNCLVISSAGSGKTTTARAKVKYLLEKRHYQEDEILVMSYNNKTAREFEDELNIPGVTVKTFHALALSIIGEAEGKRPDICDPKFLLQCYYQLVKTNLTYKRAITTYVGELASLTKFQHQYEKAEDFYKDREIYGKTAPYADMDGLPVYTKSQEETRICTWLTTHGINYRYEERYPYPTANEKYRQYKPDFTIHYVVDGISYTIYLEHFAIDKYSNVPKWFGDGKKGGFEQANLEYNKGIKWKRDIHKNKRTALIETHSSMFYDGTVWTKLENQLRKAGVPIRELSVDEQYTLLFSRDKSMEENIMNLFTSFISLMKSNGKSFESIMQSIKDSKQGKEFEDRCHFLMFEVIKPLYDFYESSLRAKDQCDFTDLILRAAELCKTKRWISPYSYILVDEFQDISVDRYKFLSALRNERPLTKLFCVGDDWQSIYRFSGSDTNLFKNFAKYFGYTEKCKIETTYRFGDPLVRQSSQFILKNPNQVPKSVKPRPGAQSTYISFEPITKDLHLSKIEQILRNIPADEKVLLLGRYNHEVSVFPPSCIKFHHDSAKADVYFANRKMEFMSIHAAKGLGADHVILLNCSQDGGGFPSRISEDPILGFVLSEIDTFEYSEERRLFYVAITRAKKHIYVLYNVNVPSVFVTEMVTNNVENKQLLCPMCKKGFLKVIKEAQAVNGNYYRNYACSNSIAGCDFFWRVFYLDENEVMIQYKSLYPSQSQSAQLAQRTSSNIWKY